MPDKEQLVDGRVLRVVNSNRASFPALSDAVLEVFPRRSLSNAAQAGHTAIRALRRGPTAFARNQIIFNCGHHAEYVGEVLTGGVRQCRIDQEGHQHVAALYLKGDIFGLSSASVYEGTAQATANNTEIMFFKCEGLYKLAAEDLSTANLLWMATAHELRRSRRHSESLDLNAQARLANFLIDISETYGSSTSAIELPMSCIDIAGYLGLTAETVSRTITHFENETGILLRIAGRRALSVPQIQILRRLETFITSDQPMKKNVAAT